MALCLVQCCSIKLKKMLILFFQYESQQQGIQKIAKGTEELLMKPDDLREIPYFVAIAYLFNPYTVLNCVAQTTTVWSNLFLAGFLYFMSMKQTLLCCLCLALETQRNFYPFVLIVPAALEFSQKRDAEQELTFTWKGVFRVLTTFLAILSFTHAISYLIVNDFSYLDATYGFM